MNDGTEEKLINKEEDDFESLVSDKDDAVSVFEKVNGEERALLSEFARADGTRAPEKVAFFNFRPPVSVAIALALGVCCAVFTLLTGFYPLLIPACILAFLALVIATIKKSIKYFVVFVCAALMFFVGFFGVCGKISNNEGKEFSGTVSTSGQGVVASSTKTKDGGFIVYLDDFKSYDGIYRGGVAVKTADDFKKGQILSIKGKMSFEKITFDNPQPLVKKYDYFFSFTQANVVGDDNDLFVMLARRVENAILKETDGQSGGVLVALVLGNTKYIDADVYESFSVSGVAHIFAVSGLHIGFLAAILGFLLDKLKIRRFLKTLIIFVITLFYSGVCGFTVSSLRAVVMCAVSGVTKSSGLKNDFLNSIAIAFVIVISLFPESLFTYGTILSFGSVTAIAMLTKTFEDAYAFMPSKLCAPLSVSSSAFFGTFPIAARMLGQTSVLTILLNIVTIPLVSVLFVLTFVGGWLTAVSGIFSFLLVPSEIIARVIAEIYGFLNIGQLVIPVEFSFLPTAIMYVDLLFVTDKLNFPVAVKKIGLIILPFTLLFFI